MSLTAKFDSDSNPIVQHYEISPFSFKSGRTCPKIRVGYCVFAEKADLPVVVLHPALTGSPRAWINGKVTQGDGWFSDYIGPNKFLDTNKFCIVCVDPIGGNGYSSSAAELEPFLSDLSFADGIEATALLLKQHGINQVEAVIGGSIGGGQAFEWLFQNQVKVNKIFDISGSACRTRTAADFFLIQAELLDFEKLGDTDLVSRLEANCSDLLGQNEAFDLIYKQVKVNLQNVINSFDLNNALKVARQIGFLRFVTPQFYQNRFTIYLEELRNRKTAEEKLLSWIDYQGQSFTERFDAKALKQLCYMDSYAPRRAPEIVAEALNLKDTKLMGFSVDGDILFPHKVQNDFYQLIKACLPASKQNLVKILTVEDKTNGHDHFLTEHFITSAKLLKNYLETDTSPLLV